MKLWLVRHGETQANAAGLYSGRAPTPLTERGEAQALRLGRQLQAVAFDRVLCSELERTQRTADLLLGERAIPREIIPDLNEMFFGDWEMRHHRDLQHEDAENYGSTRRPPTAKVFRILPGGSRHFARRWRSISILTICSSSAIRERLAC